MYREKREYNFLNQTICDACFLRAFLVNRYSSKEDKTSNRSPEENQCCKQEMGKSRKEIYFLQIPVDTKLYIATPCMYLDAL